MKSRGKKLIVVISFSFILFSSIPFISLDETYAMENGSEDIMPLADVTGWRYKVENGITYKRLFNYSKRKWIGDWIKC